MIREIYTRQENDPNYEDGILETTETIEEIMAKIRMILGTKNGDILGAYNFGVDLERMVFMSAQSQHDMEDEINKAFQQYINANEMYKVYAKISFGHQIDGGYDYAIVDIYVNDRRIQGFEVS